MTPASLRYAAPASLRAQHRRQAAGAAGGGIKPARRLKGFALGAALSALAASGVLVMVMRGDDQRRILGDVVSAHLRSLQAEHFIDVQSSDQHTVKPWFNGRLDVAPPVVDLTAQGFTLLGGRLDYIDGKPVAAIVYRRRVHIINLFCAPAPGSADRAAVMQVQGFNVRTGAKRASILGDQRHQRGRTGEFGTKFEAALKQ